MMGPCTDRSRKSIHCMSRKRHIFAHFPLKILLTACSSGTITNSIAVLKSIEGGSGLPTGCPRFTSVHFWLARGLSRWLTVCCTGGKLRLCLPHPPRSPMFSHLHSYRVGHKSPPMHRLLFPWQYCASNLHLGFIQVDICISKSHRWYSTGRFTFQLKLR